ncbi:hypothetical protein JG687_00006178 [Phytophthora cactorum]|uniref:Peptidase S74 domain-containing protein n=1 Tax=Phytophthora cactorum TaxID=29920 RepID=A0A8T1UK74_9STRA|nr:hypothetical protein JG687_00006178 [Phytophthora cactorum]
MRKCPTGVAWTDKAKTANVAHAMVECSNRGVCDYSKGECTCFNGYTGAACQRPILALQYGPDSLPSVAGDGVGPVYSNWEKDSMSSCMCDMGYTGPDCSQLMCAKNDDPLTTGQGYRTIQIQVDADASTNIALAGSSMRTVLTATCTITSVNPVTAAAIYTVAFKEWVHLDVTATNVIEHVYCSNRGLCDFTTGECMCYADFKGLDCNQPSNVPDSIDDNDGFIINPMGLTYTGTVLHLKTAKGSQADFYFMKIGSSTLPILTMNGMGDTKLLNGNFELSTGSLTITTIAQTSTVADIANTHTTFTGTALKVRTTRASNNAFKLLEAMTGGTTTVVEIRGDGLTTIYTGGLYVVTGGGRISHTLDGPSLTVTNSYGSFSNSLLKLSTSRASLFPGASDFVLIEATANSFPAFTVEASGRTTIANGGLIVTGLGGAQISNSDPADPALVVSATGASFTGDAVAIKTFSGSAHNMLKVTTKVGSNAAIDLFTISNSGLTTITQGGLHIVSGGATIDTGGLHVGYGGETIDFGGLRVKNGGGTIELGGLNVINGGGKIASTSAVADILTVEATSTLFSNNARAGSPAASVFTVDATGATTITAGGLSVGGGVTVSNTGLTVSGGGASITGGITAVDTGVTVTTGGARIYDTSTTADTLKVKNTATGTFSGALLSLDTGTLTSGFSLISAGVAGGSPKFSVAASGLTTIAAGGLSVTGGVTITNTGLTVTTGGASITDTGTATSTLTLTNSAGTFDKALLSMDSTATSGFSLINAMVGGTPQFTVAAGGATTIASGGLSIKGGVTVVDTGVTVSAGDVLISSNTQSAATNSGALVVTGGVGIGRDLRCAGTIYGTVVTTPSDRRLKTTIQDLSSSQEIIRQLHPVTYEWRRDQFPSRNFPGGVFHGFLADEVEQILPDLVEEDADGWKSLNYVGIVPHLVRAVQEMQGQLEASQVHLTRMQHQIDALLAARA